MTRFTWMLGVVGLVACSGGDDGSGTTPSDADGTTPAACSNTISETFPADGETDAFYKTNVEFTLLTAEASATIAVTGPAGDVAGSTTVDGNSVVWTPDGDLDASTEYTATLTFSCDPASVSFTTSDVGTPADTADINGGVYSLPLTEGRFVEPPGIGDIIGGLIAVTVLIETEIAGSELNMLGALALESDPNAQDLCTETIDFPNAADFTENPYFSVGPDDTVISVAGFDVAIDDLAISGAFSPSGDRIAGAALSGSIDTRPLVPLVASGAGDSGVCDLVAGFGITCIECSDGTGAYCLALVVEDMTALKAAGTDLVTRSTADIDADPNCDSATTN